MSWTPDIWVSRVDFQAVKSRLDALDTCNAWEFDIAGKRGVVLSAGESSMANREIHAIFEDEGIEHWLLNSEGAECDSCQTWGEQIMERDDGC